MKKRAVFILYYLFWFSILCTDACYQVVMDSAERKVTAFLQQVNTIHNRKVP
jgi:hypothetical protein